MKRLIIWKEWKINIWKEFYIQNGWNSKNSFEVKSFLFHQFCYQTKWNYIGISIQFRVIDMHIFCRTSHSKLNFWSRQRFFLFCISSAFCVIIFIHNFNSNERKGFNWCTLFFGENDDIMHSFEIRNARIQRTLD